MIVYPDAGYDSFISVDAARKIYYAAVKRMISVIIEMDAVHKMTLAERKSGGCGQAKAIPGKEPGQGQRPSTGTLCPE